MAVMAKIAHNTGLAFHQANLIKNPEYKGRFSFIIPLKHIFGFCDNYNKIIYRLKHELMLVRKINDDAIFWKNNTTAGKMRLDKISWFMLHVILLSLE